jgi:hypothetical protein
MRAMVWAEWLLLASAIYLMIGVVVGVAFLSLGVKKVDSAAIGAPITFRMIVFPGTVVLWPAVLVMWLRSVH